MSNYYYDQSKNCYRKKRNHHKKCNCECNRHPRYHTFTSGPLFSNADTDFIQVSALNQTDEPQTVTIAVQNYQDTCDGDILVVINNNEQIVRKYIILDSKVALIGLKNDEQIIITKPEDVQIIYNNNFKLKKQAFILNINACFLVLV